MSREGRRPTASCNGLRLRAAAERVIVGRQQRMPLHWVKIIESGHLSTQRLFELGISFSVCKRMRLWPSVETMNSFLAQGTDDGQLGTTIEWEPFRLRQDEYEQSVTAFMQGEAFKFDVEPRRWEEWFEEMSKGSR
jgi:hypothetical protein